jgi:hypothetical protein
MKKIKKQYMKYKTPNNTFIQAKIQDTHNLL